MVKVNVDLNGLKITMEGSTEEIGDILDNLKEREERKREKEERFKRWRETREQRVKRRNEENHTFHPRNLTSVINNYIEKGFFDTPKIAKDVLVKLEKDGLGVPSTTLHPILARFVMKGILIREKNSNEVWAYGVKK